jgi:thioesterase domain-containing protein
VNARDLEAYLHEHIPLSKAMQVSVVEASPERVVLSAPLAPNINHRETVFGGSASAVAILACWSLLHLRLGGAGLVSRLVIQRNTMNYALPIAGAFTATAALPSPDGWASFVRTLERKGRARIKAAAVIEHGGQAACHFEGEFVALASAK